MVLDGVYNPLLTNAPTDNTLSGRMHSLMNNTNRKINDILLTNLSSVYYRRAKKKLNNSTYLLFNSNVAGCFLTFCSSCILIARSFCATQGSNLVFTNFAFITIIPIVFRIRRLPYTLTVSFSYILILIYDVLIVRESGHLIAKKS